VAGVDLKFSKRIALATSLPQSSLRSDSSLVRGSLSCLPLHMLAERACRRWIFAKQKDGGRDNGISPYKTPSICAAIIINITAGQSTRSEMRKSARRRSGEYSSSSRSMRSGRSS